MPDVSEAAPQTIAQRRMIWFVIFAALCVAPVAYAVIVRVAAPSVTRLGELPRFHAAFLLFASIQGLLGAVVLLRARQPRLGFGVEGSSPADALASPEQFQRYSLVGMAMIEAVGVYGFVLAFMGNDPAECVLWSAASVLGLLGVALPVGWAYWRDLEQQSATSGQPLN